MARAWIAGAAMLVALLLFAVLGVRSWATEKAVRLDAVPTPPPLSVVGVVEVPPGARACARPIVVGRHSEQLSFRLATFGQPGEAVRVQLRGRGYRRVARVAPGYPDGTTEVLAVRPPPRDVVAEACFSNLGRRKLALYAGGDEQSQSRSTTTVAGRRAEHDITLSFSESSPSSLLGRVPETMRRLTVFRPGVVGSWLTWALLVLVALGVPLAAAWAIVAATRADDDDAVP